MSSDRDRDALLLTTHSPHIVSVSPLNAIVLLRRESNVGTKGFTARGAGLDAQQVRDIERYLDVTRAEMLFARGVILVEGIAELYLVPEFARAMGHDLDALGVTVCSVHGTDFLPYRRMLRSNAFAIPHVIITDGDPDSSGIAAASTGIERGRALLAAVGGNVSAIESAISANDANGALTALAAQDVFVGGRTLETDLLPHATSALQGAFEALVESPTRRTSFAAAVTGAAAGDAAMAAKMLGRIEDLGKGRFAQQVASRLVGVSPPAYIAQAIERIVSHIKPHA